LIVSWQLTDQKNGKDTHTMSNDNVFALKKPDTFVDDPITNILRQGAKKLLAQALKTKIEIFLNNYRQLSDELGGIRQEYSNLWWSETKPNTGAKDVPN